MAVTYYIAVIGRTAHKRLVSVYMFRVLVY